MRVSPWLRHHSHVHASLLGAVREAVSLSPSIVYLCGGINGLPDSACIDWRVRVKEMVSGSGVPGIRFLDPMDRDYRGREDECVNEIVEGDKQDIDRCDVVLVNASKPSWGTAMEVLYAFERGKRVVAFMAE